MAQQSVVCVYDTHDIAEAAVQALNAAGGVNEAV